MENNGYGDANNVLYQILKNIDEFNNIRFDLSG